MSQRPGRRIARRYALRARRDDEKLSSTLGNYHTALAAQGEWPADRANRADRRARARLLRSIEQARPVVGGVYGGRMAAHCAFAQRGTVGKKAKRAKVSAARRAIAGELA